MGSTSHSQSLILSKTEGPQYHIVQTPISRKRYILLAFNIIFTTLKYGFHVSREPIKWDWLLDNFGHYRMQFSPTKMLLNFGRFVVE